MREIKFRAYLKLDNGISKQDPSFCEKKVMVRVNSVHMDEDGVQDITVVDDYFSDGDLVDSVFDPDTMALMQFTGLKDRNGTEIYEGDILQMEECRGFVTFKGGILCVERRIPYNEGKYVPFLDWPAEAFEDCEIIGNIFGNPELLEAEG